MPWPDVASSPACVLLPACLWLSHIRPFLPRRRTSSLVQPGRIGLVFERGRTQCLFERVHSPLSREDQFKPSGQRLAYPSCSQQCQFFVAHDSGEEAASSSARGWRIHHALEGGCFPGTGSGAASATSTAPGPTHAGGCLFCIWRNRVALYLLWPKELRPSLHPLEAAYLQSLGGETALE